MMIRATLMMLWMLWQSFATAAQPGLLVSNTSNEDLEFVSLTYIAHASPKDHGRWVEGVFVKIPALKECELVVETGAHSLEIKSISWWDPLYGLRNQGFVAGELVISTRTKITIEPSVDVLGKDVLLKALKFNAAEKVPQIYRWPFCDVDIGGGVQRGTKCEFNWKALSDASIKETRSKILPDAKLDRPHRRLFQRQFHVACVIAAITGQKAPLYPFDYFAFLFPEHQTDFYRLVLRGLTDAPDFVKDAIELSRVAVEAGFAYAMKK
jgi:hypothetical protein